LQFLVTIGECLLIAGSVGKVLSSLGKHFTLQFAPLICTSVISTLRILARRASGPIRVYVMSMAVNFVYKH